MYTFKVFKNKMSLTGNLKIYDHLHLITLYSSKYVPILTSGIVYLVEFLYFDCNKTGSSLFEGNNRSQYHCCYYYFTSSFNGTEPFIYKASHGPLYFHSAISP